MEPAAEPDDPEFGDDAHCRAALHRPDVESAAEPDEPDTGDTAPSEQLFTDLVWNQQQN